MKHWFKYLISLIAFVGLLYACSGTKTVTSSKESVIEDIESVLDDVDEVSVLDNDISDSDSKDSIETFITAVEEEYWSDGNNDMPFLAIYNNILKTNCTLSNCHDGNFEPNFTSPQSAYNTTVLHEMIKNSRDLTYTNRVTPFDTAHSMLYERLTNCCLNNNNDQMPLLMGALSKGQIDSISAWIMNGAPDAYGEFPYLELSIFAVH